MQIRALLLVGALVGLAGFVPPEPASASLPSQNTSHGSDCTVTPPARIKMAARTTKKLVDVTCSMPTVDLAEWSVHAGGRTIEAVHWEPGYEIPHNW